MREKGYSYLDSTYVFSPTLQIIRGAIAAKLYPKKQLAKELGISTSLFSQLIRGERRFSSEMENNLFQILNINKELRNALLLLIEKI